MMLTDDRASSVFSSLSSLSLALHRYVVSPEDGLYALQHSLPDFRSRAHAMVAEPDFFFRLDLLDKALVSMIDAGSVFDPEFQKALYEGLDVFEQVIFASSLGGDYIDQTRCLLDCQRDCWQILDAISSRQLFQPLLRYSGVLTSSCHSSMERLLDDLSLIGEVSFHVKQHDRLRSDQANSIKWVELKTIQPLTWLQSQYPYMDWVLQRRELSYEPVLSQPLLSSMAFPTLFLSKILPRNVHYSLLDDMGQWVREKQYRAFAECFSPDGFVGQIDRPARRVPVEKGFQDISIANFDGVATPIRLSGGFFACFYWPHLTTSAIAFPSHEEGALSVDDDTTLTDGEPSHIPPSPVYLGRDILSTSLLLVGTKWGELAFEQDDCEGAYQLDRGAFFQTDPSSGRWWCALDNEKTAVLVLSLGGDKELEPFKVDALLDSNPVLVVRQGGVLYALLYKTLTLSEGVCGYNSAMSHRVKNLWFTHYSESIIEPWLINTDLITGAWLPMVQELPNQSSRVGFYCVFIDEVSIWLDASLVLDVLPFASCKRVGQLVIYGVQYFHRSIYGLGVKKRQFVLFVKGAGGFVLEADECVWHRDAPTISTSAFENIMCIGGSDDAIGIHQKNKKDIIINKENIARFVGHCWPATSLLKV